LYTLVIRNGRVVDGSGNPWFYGDIGIQDDKIAYIGKLGGVQARKTIHADGQIVAPGFIDIHTHSDFPLVADGYAQGHVRQGVTTEAIGNCGSSSVPLSDETAKLMEDMGVGPYGDIKLDWRTPEEYLARLETKRVSINVVPLIGHGTVRQFVMGFEDRSPSSEEMDQMKALVKQAMEAGYFGMSTGLIYVPSCYASTDEIAELAKVVREYGGLYSTHIRGENDTVLTAIKEAIEIGRKSGTKVQISHLKAMGRHMWGKSIEILKLIDDARWEGLDVTFDQYPYNASATGLSAVLPPWVQSGGKHIFMQRLKDPEIRARMRHEILEGTDGWTSLHKGVGWENILITHCRDKGLEGKSVAEIARERGKDGFEICFDLLLEFQGQVSVVYFTIGDEDLERIMSHPAMMVGSDSSALSTEGVLARGKPHPRSFGTFVRILGTYVREKRLLSLEEAVRRMTSAPAQKLGLFDRGLLRPGMKADIVVFDPVTVADNATYTEPFNYPTGVSTVVVNGTITVEDGQHTGALAGNVLRQSVKR